MVRSCLLITLITCLKGHKSLGVLFGSVVQNRQSVSQGKVQKKKLKKKLTNVSFAFTHTYTPVKTNIFRFFPQSYMENFEKCAKTQKQKNNMLSHVTCGC